MLSKHLRVTPRLLFRTANASTAVAAPKYDTVKFVKEDIESVMKEVPDVKYYYFGGNTEPNPYQSVPIDEPVLHETHAPKIVEPKMRFSKLENGLRIVSIDKQGLVSQLGLFVNAGSRFEQPHEFGVSHMAEIMAYHSTAHLSHLRTIKTIETLGANATCQAGREHIMYHIETLRDQMPIMVPVLIGNTLFPRMLPWEVNKAHQYVEAANKKLLGAPEKYIMELVYQTGFHNNTLGHKTLASSSALEYFTPDVVRSYMLRNYSIDKTVFVGVNVDHDELAKWVMRSYAEYTPIKNTDRPVVKPVYTGGSKMSECDQLSHSAHVAIGFGTEGWNSPDLVPLTVLQMLLGGGGSFSSGGPGKGMHSRLYTEVMQQHHFVENCVAFNEQLSDGGLFGFYLSGAAEDAAKLVDIARNQWKSLSKFSPEEIARAKNSLKGTICTHSDNSRVLMEDIGRQLLMSGTVQSASDFAAMIDKVTEADLVKVAKKLSAQPVTYVVHGNTKFAPHPHAVQAAFK
jgi:mitochondrial-processing peptidase subunit alpha